MSASTLARIDDLFDRAEVPYAVIGAHGVHAWIEPRFCADIDITASIDPTAAAVPDPASVAMLLAGLGTLGLMTRRRRPPGSAHS